MTKPSEGTAQKLDGLVQETEELRAENEQLKARLQAAQELLGPQWETCGKLMVVFGDAAPFATAPSKTDPLGRFRLLLENAPRASYRVVAQALADMGGRATQKQLGSATKYSAPTVKNSVIWLKSNGVTYKEGTEVLLVE